MSPGLEDLILSQSSCEVFPPKPELLRSTLQALEALWLA